MSLQNSLCSDKNRELSIQKASYFEKAKEDER